MSKVLSTLLVALFCAGLTALPGAPAAAAATPGVTSEAVSFTVQNRNATALACPADGRRHELRGRLVSPADGGTPGRVNVLVHDFTTGGWFWHLREHPAYDYASRLAERGETSLVLDRLGYDASPLADGRRTCLGAQATMLHQVIEQLRADGAEQVVVHGHVVGAAIAELEAASFDDVDGLVIMAWADSGPTVRAILESGKQHVACLLSRDGYAPYGATDEDFQQLLFASAEPDVVAAATARRNPDPCGDALTLGPLVVLDNLLTRRIDVPVLLLFGEQDALIRADARTWQRLAYAPGAEVTTYVAPGDGSALPLEAGAAQTRQRVLGWLAEL